MTLFCTINDDLRRMLVSEMTLEELAKNYASGYFLEEIKREIKRMPIVLQMYLMENPSFKNFLTFPMYKLIKYENLKFYLVRTAFRQCLNPTLTLEEDGYSLMYNEVMLELSELFNYPVGQRRTGKSKQFTFIVNDLIYKGPYREEKAKKILARAAVLKRWNVHLAVLPQEMLQNESGFFLVFPNVDSSETTEYESEGESFSNYQVKVQKRGNLVKFNDIFEKQSWTHEFVTELTFSLICLYVLEVGDTGLFNILADTVKKTVFVIDYEDDAGQSLDPHFYFSKIAKKKWELWQKHIQYPTLLERLSDLYSDPEYGEEFQKAVERLGVKVEVPPMREPEIKLTSDPGKMAYHGMFGGSTGYSGYSLDVLKSALQKYIRRGNIKALMAAVELFRLGSLDGAKAIMTNLGNRLAVIAAEDIGPSNIWLVISVINGVLNKNFTLPWIIASCLQLMKSTKTRICSHLYFALANPLGRKKALEIGYVSEEAPRETGFDQNFWRSDDPEVIRLPLEMFVLSLQRKSFKSFYWLSEYLRLSENLKVSRRNRRTKPEICLWVVLEKFLPKNILDTLQAAYFSITENRPFLQLAVVVALYKPPYEKVVIDTEKVGSSVLQRLVEGKYTFILDSYVIDKHTKEGRENGMNREDFVKEGALVIPEDPRFITMFKNIYEC